MTQSRRSISRNIATSNDASQSTTPFVERLIEALNGRSVAWLAKESGVNDGTLRNYLRGTQPTIIPAVQIASALGTTLDWLLGGIGPKTKAEADRARLAERTVGRELFDAAEAEWVFIPFYSFESYFDSYAPNIRETYPVRKDWLNRSFGTSTGLWMTHMPSDDLPDVAAAGETIICRNVRDISAGGVFILGVDGSLFARRLSGIDGDYFFESDRPDAPRISVACDYVLVGSVLARYGVSPVAPPSAVKSL